MVLLPARTLQEILPYSLAIGGLQATNVSNVTAPAPAPRTPVAGEPAPAPAPASTACYPSLAAAIAATPELSIQRQQLPLSGVSRVSTKLRLAGRTRVGGALSKYIDELQLLPLHLLRSPSYFCCSGTFQTLQST